MTLVEILVATTVMLILMGLVISLFGFISDTIGDSRSTMEMTSSLRTVTAQLESDLSNVTVTMLPPRSVEENEGYFEYIEGPVGPRLLPDEVAFDSLTGEPDSTVGDFDDILMFTIRSKDKPFVGRWGNGTIESNEAEVVWFVRGTTLYRRVMLIVPQDRLQNKMRTPSSGTPDPWQNDDTRFGFGFYKWFDVSVHGDPNSAPAPGRIVANTLADLTKRENRFAHSPIVGQFPNHPHVNYGVAPPVETGWAILGLPTQQECAFIDASIVWPKADPADNPNDDLTDNGSLYWQAGAPLSNLTLTPSASAFPPGATAAQRLDAWGPSPHPHPYDELAPDTGMFKPYSKSDNRIGEDIILTHVIGFDVKAWDPGAPILDAGTTVVKPGDVGYLDAMSKGFAQADAGAYVDLGYGVRLGPGATGLSPFAGEPHVKSGLRGLSSFVYDTWSTHYEDDGVNQDGGPVDQGTNGFDDDGDGSVDEPDERETQPPYETPLRGIQVTIRVFDPDSEQIREISIVHEFLPQ